MVHSAGFEGHNDLWVGGDAMRAFCKALVALENARQGEAKLESISPDEFQLCVHAVSSGGHMAVAGATGYEIQREDAAFFHSVTFGFEFDPPQLMNAVKVDWVKKYASW